jgi:hypothetical protein
MKRTGVGVSADHVHGFGRFNSCQIPSGGRATRVRTDTGGAFTPDRLAALHRTHGQGLLLLWGDPMGSLREKCHGASVLAELERLRVA